MNTIDVVLKEIKDLRKHLDTNFPSKADPKGFATKDDLKAFATKDDLKREIRGVIEYMDDSFVREHKLERLEKTVANHTARLSILEQK